MSIPNNDTPKADAGASETPGSESQSENPAATPQEQAPEGDSQKFVTLEQAQKMVEDASEQTFRKSQSYSDAGRVRVEAAVDTMKESIQTVRKSGKEITLEEEQQMLKSARAEAIANPPAEPEAAQGNVPNVTDAQRMEFTTRLDVLIDTHGKENLLAEGDPELKMLKYTGVPKDDAVMVEAAMLAKKARLQNEPNNTDETTPPISERVPSDSGPVGQTPMKNAHEGWGRVKEARKK